MDINRREVITFSCILFCYVSSITCIINLTATANTQTLVSHDEFDRVSFYPDINYTKDWLITAEKENCTITLEFTHCELETGNGKGVCIEDLIFIYDGHNTSASLLQETCCGLDHESVIHGTGSQVYILFSTDHTLTNTGFSINYILTGVTTSSASETSTASIQIFSPAAQLQSMIDDDNGEKYRVFLIAVFAISALVLIVLSIFGVIYMTKKGKRKTEYKNTDGNSTLQSPANVRQPQPEMLIYSKANEIPLCSNEHNISSEKVLDLSKEQKTQPAPLFVTTLPTIYEECLSDSKDHLQIRKTDCASRSSKDKQLHRKRLRYEIISSLIQNDHGVIITDNNKVDSMYVDAPHRDISSHEKHINMTSNMHNEHGGDNTFINQDMLHGQEEITCSVSESFQANFMSTDWHPSDDATLKSIIDNHDHPACASTLSVSGGISADVNLKSLIDSECLAKMSTLPPVESTSATPDKNANINHINRAVTPGIRRLPAHKFPLLVNAKSPRNT